MDARMKTSMSDDRRSLNSLDDIEFAVARIEKLEAKLAADRTELIALIRKDAENGDISHGAAQWVIDTILAELKGQE
jgi:hypothetical protein